MMRGQIKEMVLDMLRSNGPMTLKQLSEALGLERWAAEGAVRSLHSDGTIYMFKKDRRHCNTWASR